jgi:hypothetical protein
MSAPRIIRRAAFTKSKRQFRPLPFTGVPGQRLREIIPPLKATVAVILRAQLRISERSVRRLTAA